MPPPPPPRPARARPARNKSVTFCTRCELRPPPRDDPDVRYYSDPGHPDPPRPRKPKTRSPAPIEQRYYSEPDVKYFEIDYEFLRELRKIARNNCPKCRRRSRKTAGAKPRRREARETYVLCNGRYHSNLQHCQLCCRICARSTDTLDSIDDEYSLVSRSSSRSKPAARSRSTPRRKTSIQSNKSVSFLESSTESMKDEPNYTAKSFTNDLKRFLLKPSPPRLSLRDKFMISFKQELEATKRSPKLRAIKGLWKSY